MIPSAEVVADIPQSWSRLTGHRGATLNALSGCLRVVASATHLRANGAARNHAAYGRKILARAATDLVPQNTADQSTDNSAADIRLGRLGHLLRLNPASLLRRSDDSTYRCHIGLEQPLISASAVVVGGWRIWRITIVIHASIADDRTN